MSENDFRSEDARVEAAEAAAADEQVTEPDPGVIDPEAEEAAEGLQAGDDVGEHYREMTERGAHARGEGRI